MEIRDCESMFKCKFEEYKKIFSNKKYLRIKDKHGHFLGKVVPDGSLYIYCKRCKEFHYCCKVTLEEGGAIDESKEDIS